MSCLRPKLQRCNAAMVHPEQQGTLVETGWQREFPLPWTWSACSFMVSWERQMSLFSWNITSQFAEKPNRYTQNVIMNNILYYYMSIRFCKWIAQNHSDRRVAKLRRMKGITVLIIETGNVGHMGPQCNIVTSHPWHQCRPNICQDKLLPKMKPSS